MTLLIMGFAPIAVASPTPTTTALSPPPITATSTPGVCASEDCIPTATTAPATPEPTPSQPGNTSGDADCELWNLTGCVSNAITGFFRGLVTAALDPLLDVLGHTVLTTPPIETLPRVGELWTNSWQIMLACYGLLILIAGILVMAYHSLHTHYSIKEILPRIITGFLAGALSLFVATKAIELANALALAMLSDGVNADSAAQALRSMVLDSAGGGIFLLFLGLVLAGIVVALLVTFVIRVAVTIMLIIAAPVLLMCHALPHTEGIARWWWKAFAGCLAIQVAQSLTLVTAIRVLLTPSGFSLFGAVTTPVVNLIVAVALMVILLKIPFWILGSLNKGRPGVIRSRARGWASHHTRGILGHRNTSKLSSPKSRSRGQNTDADPYAATRVRRDGQYVLPLQGIKRARSSRTTTRSGAAPQRRRLGRQLALPLGRDWPENTPRLGKDGQYQFPFTERGTRGRPRQHRTADQPSPPITSTPRRTVRRRARQLVLPFDPYEGITPLRNGQYPLPLDDPKPRRAQTSTATTTSSSLPQVRRRRVRRRGRQLPLPLDIPRAPRRRQPSDTGRKDTTS